MPKQEIIVVPANCKVEVQDSYLAGKVIWSKTASLLFHDDHLHVIVKRKLGAIKVAYDADITSDGKNLIAHFFCLPGDSIILQGGKEPCMVWRINEEIWKPELLWVKNVS